MATKWPLISLEASNGTFHFDSLTGQHVRLGTTDTFQSWTRVVAPQPGDITLNSHHCGIYIGNGQMIHAPRTGDVVKISAVHPDMIYVRY